MNTKPIVRFFKKHSGTILSVLASGGVLATAIFSGKAAVKAHIKLEEAQKEADHELTTGEKVKTVATTFIAPVMFGASTIACIFGISILDNKKYASLACSYGMLRTTYTKYKNRVIDKHGINEHVEIVKEIAPKRFDVEKANSAYMHASCDFKDITLDVDTDEEVRLFYLVNDERYFESTISKVLQAMYHLNRNMLLGGEVCAEIWYDFLGIKQEEGCDQLFWSPNDCYQWIDFDMKKVELEDGLECIYIEPVWGPDTIDNLEELFY